MTNLEKEQHWINISYSSDSKPKIKPIGNHSLQLILPCGCKQTQNFYCRKSDNEEVQSIRFQYFEFCDKHKK
jgi:hypothetical protein